MSATNLAEDPLTARLRYKLNGESMKLWLDPFYDSTTQTPNDTEVIALASRYAVELELPESDVITCLFALQRHAVEKIVERETFKSTGKATVRVRYSGQLSDAERAAASKLQKLQICLSTANGSDLKNMIADELKISPNRLKLICSGKVLEEGKMLDAQYLRNGSQIMALFLTTDKESFQVADQSGRPLELPENEKKALAVGLALHDKGRAALKLNDFSKALVFLLEADSVYKQCQSALLDMVDNYGLLNLDIAWCYLSLQSIAELPEAEARLQKCERALRKSYGEDLERVVALKGSTGWEAALFVRLHLLQAIAAYHLGQIEKSKFLMNKAEGELNRLRVSDDKLAELINMGYKENESRMALRATYGDTSLAVEWIIRRREEMQEIKRQEKEKSERRKLQKKLGSCDNGEPMNTRTFMQLKEMGYSPTLIAAALRRSNNDMNVAIQLLADDEFIRQARAGIQLESNAPSTSAAANAVEAVAAATASSEPNQQNGELIQTLADQLFENMLQNDMLLDEAEIEKSQKAYESLKKDTCSESEYIDLTLSTEMQYLEQYKMLLATLS